MAWIVGLLCQQLVDEREVRRRLAGELDLAAGRGGMVEPVSQQPGAGQVQRFDTVVVDRDRLVIGLTIRAQLRQRGFDLTEVLDAPRAAQSQRQAISRSFRFE
jgi:hypothetical protein